MGGPRKHLEACLEGLCKHNQTPCELLVVAYLWTGEDKLSFASRWPSVKLIPSDEIRGFAENNNLALSLASGRYCLVVNDDTLMEMPVIDRLVADFERLPKDAAALSPKIVLGGGKVQTCGRAPWTMWRYMLHYLHFVDETRPGEWSMKEGLFRTWTLNGACFLIRTDVFRSLGWFDERFFFTPEDIALGQLLNDSGYSVWTDADVVITHLAGATVSPMEAAIKPARVAGAMLFYCGDSKWRRMLLGGFIRLVEGLRMLRHSLTGRTSGHGKLMYDTARNVRRAVASGKLPKEVFLSFYREL